MEGTIQHDSSFDALRTTSEQAVAEFKKEAERAGELSCNQLLKNLVKTNVRLLNLNEISTMLLLF